MLHFVHISSLGFLSTGMLTLKLLHRIAPVTLHSSNNPTKTTPPPISHITLPPPPKGFTNYFGGFVPIFGIIFLGVNAASHFGVKSSTSGN